jgi:hypothetical protein
MVMGKASRQLKFDFAKPREVQCQHDRTFVTMAYVPAGVFCFDCGLLLSQYLPTPPEILGYVSATWKWHHIDGRPWTTQTKRPGGYLYK